MCKVTSAPPPKARKAVSASKPSRRVRFGQIQAKVFSQHLSRSEKQTMWYSGSDFKAMNKEVHRSLKKELYYGFDPNDEQRTWRGLEHIREGVPNVKLQRRRSFVRGLLYFHKTMGVTDPEELGTIASTESNMDQVRARQFADYDAYEASCVYYENPHWQTHPIHDSWSPIPVISPCNSTDEDLEEDYKEFCNIPRSKEHNGVSPTRKELVPRTA